MFEVVILTGHGTIESALSCKEGGAYSFLQKPCELDILLETLVKAYKTRLMNRKKVDAEKIKEILNIEASPWEILRRLKEIDSE